MADLESKDNMPTHPLKSSPPTDSQDEKRLVIDTNSKNWEKDIIERSDTAGTQLPAYRTATSATLPPFYESEEDESIHGVPTSAEDLTKHVIHAVDDPTDNPWTFRTWFLGLWLSA